MRDGPSARDPDIRDAERALAVETENGYGRTIADWKATRPTKGGRERDTEASIK